MDREPATARFSAAAREPIGRPASDSDTSPLLKCHTSSGGGALPRQRPLHPYLPSAQDPVPANLVAAACPQEGTSAATILNSFVFGYHRGPVWPVEHGSFAIGFLRYGLREHLSRLCRALPSTFHTPAPHARQTGETIGRRRFRGDGGILLAKRELALEFGDPFRLLGILLAKLLILPTQSLNLRRTWARRRRRLRRWWRAMCPRWASPLHAGEGTESRGQVQEP